VDPAGAEAMGAMLRGNSTLTALALKAARRPRGTAGHRLVARATCGDTLRHRIPRYTTQNHARVQWAAELPPGGTAPPRKESAPPSPCS